MISSSVVIRMGGSLRRRWVLRRISIWISAASVWVRVSGVTRVRFDIECGDHVIPFFSIGGVSKPVLEIS